MKTRSLGQFEQLLLWALVRESPLRGLHVQRQIEKRTGRDLAAGAVYASLNRLVEKKLAKVTELDGARYYGITARGERELAAAQQSLQQMQRGLSLLA